MLLLLLLLRSGASLASSPTSRLFLTSSGLTTPLLRAKFGSMLRTAADSSASGETLRIAMLVTAQMASSAPATAATAASKRSPGELRRRRWANARKSARDFQEDLTAFMGAPVQVDPIDCARDHLSQLTSAIESSQCVWVCGGNTFFLWHHMRRSGVAQVIARRVEHDGLLYAGCSAGAIVAGRSIEIAHWKGWDDPNAADENWDAPGAHEAMGLVSSCSFFPHYAEEWRELAQSKAAQLGHQLTCIDETSAFVVDGEAGEGDSRSEGRLVPCQAQEPAVPELVKIK